MSSVGLVVRFALLAWLGLVVAACGASKAGRPLAIPPVSALPSSPGSHVVEIVMENKEASDVIGSATAPFVNRLARGGGLATASFAITHPSLPNYLALTSGATHGITDDCTDCHLGATNLADQLEHARVSWKAYMEDLPSQCFKGSSSGGYAKKHDPFAYYDDIVRSPERCRKIVSFAQLAADLSRGALPTYAFVAPNLCDDTHDCPVATGDRTLARLVPRIVHELGPHGFLILTWDEGNSNQGCCGGAHGGRIATVVVGPDVQKGARDGVPVDHYGVLRTIEDALRLPRLGGARDARHGTVAPLFRRAPRAR